MQAKLRSQCATLASKIPCENCLSRELNPTHFGGRPAHTTLWAVSPRYSIHVAKIKFLFLFYPSLSITLKLTTTAHGPISLLAIIEWMKNDNKKKTRSWKDNFTHSHVCVWIIRHHHYNVMSQSLGYIIELNSHTLQYCWLYPHQHRDGWIVYLYIAILNIVYIRKIR